MIWFDTAATLVDRSGELDVIVVAGAEKVMGEPVAPSKTPIISVFPF